MSYRNQEKWDELLIPNNRVGEHLPQGNLVHGLPESARLASEQSETFWEQQRLSIQRQIASLPERRTSSVRLAWAAATILILIASFLLQTASRVPAPPSASTSDRELLVEVEQALEGDVPQALQPAALIANEIDQSAQVPSNSVSSKEKSQHED